MTTHTEAVIELKDVSITLGGSRIHDHLNLSIFRGEILGIVGGSGSGKTTLLREILMLQPPDSGSVKVFGTELMSASSETLLEVQKRWGVLFQQNALFSSLSVLNNVAFPLSEHYQLEEEALQTLSLLKIKWVGLPLDSAVKYPSELSGGMEKRAALARAIVLDPELLFLDEPTAGLDPTSATGLDELILTLRSIMGLTVVVVTHDLDTLWAITDRVAFLGEGKIVCVEPMEKLVKNSHPSIKDFFNGPRGESAERIYSRHANKR